MMFAAFGEVRIFVAFVDKKRICFKMCSGFFVFSENRTVEQKETSNDHSKQAVNDFGI